MADRPGFTHSTNPTKEETSAYFRALNEGKPGPDHIDRGDVDKLRDLGYSAQEVGLTSDEIDARLETPQTEIQEVLTEDAEEGGPENLEKGRLNIPYDKFIENVDGYLTGYLYAKQELEKLEAERKPSRILGTDFQPGFNQTRWKELMTQTVRMSMAFRVHRTRALAEKPELKELFDQFNESK